MAKGVPQIPREAAIVVTCLEDWPEPGPQFPQMEQIDGPRTYCMQGCAFGVADVGGPDNIDIRIIDLVRADYKNVRWRDVEKMCENRGIATVPIAYRGEGRAAPGDLLDRAPYVAFRLENRGPWMLVRRPVRGGSIAHPEPLIDLED